MPIEWLIITWLYGTGVWIMAGVAEHAAPTADLRHVWLAAMLWPVIPLAIYAWRKFKNG